MVPLLLPREVFSLGKNMYGKIPILLVPYYFFTAKMFVGVFRRRKIFVTLIHH